MKKKAGRGSEDAGRVPTIGAKTWLLKGKAEIREHRGGQEKLTSEVKVMLVNVFVTAAEGLGGGWVEVIIFSILLSLSGQLHFPSLIVKYHILLECIMPSIAMML